MNWRGAFTCCALLTLPLLLGGCPVFPYWISPGYYESRSNLQDLSQIQIVPGKTTRTEILGKLGSPEVAATDDRWFYYESDFLKEESGAWVVIGGPGFGTIAPVPTNQVMLFKRLYISFDDKGLVFTATSDEQECKGIPHPKLILSDYKTSNQYLTSKQMQSCGILQRGWELRERRFLQRLSNAVSEDSAYERFEGALWKIGRVSKYGEKGFYCRASPRGTLFVSKRQLMYLPNESTYAGTPPEPIHVDRSEIASVTLLETWPKILGLYGIEIKKNDGTYAALTFCNIDEDPKTIREIYSLLLDGSLSDRQRP